jgi:hypothetical protein
MISQQEQEFLIKMEQEIIAAQKHGDYSFVEKALASDFREIDSRGSISYKAETIQAIKEAPLKDYSVVNCEVFPVAEDCAIVTYIATNSRSISEGMRVNRARRSSTWVKRGGSWHIVFHQGTPLMD